MRYRDSVLRYAERHSVAKASVKFNEPDKNYQIPKLYQFTAIDTFSRLRILEGYLEQSTYTAWLFLVQVLFFYKAHGIEVKMVQTDNGPIFTNRFLTTNNDKLTLFE